MSRPRIALYGHDSMGLGHLRRNLILAQTLSGLPEAPDILIISGTIEVSGQILPPRTDVLQVPSVFKDPFGRYRSRRLGIAFDEVVEVRRQIIQAALMTFGPDLMIVDKVASGLGSELCPTLEMLGAVHGTRLVLGLRDVLDSPIVVQREWEAARTHELIRDHYDEVWIYGDPAVYDVIDECGLGNIDAPLRYTGYLAEGRSTTALRPPVVDGRSRYFLCTVGGGADGLRIADAFSTAVLPRETVGVLVAGPDMANRHFIDLQHRVASRDDMHLIRSHPQVGDWMSEADGVIAMGGYNTVSELLATDTPGLIIPRKAPRVEQSIRATVMASLGLFDTIERPDIREIERWMAATTARPSVDRSALRLDGLASVRRLAHSVLNTEVDNAIAI